MQSAVFRCRGKSVKMSSSWRLNAVDLICSAEITLKSSKINYTGTSQSFLKYEKLLASSSVQLCSQIVDTGQPCLFTLYILFINAGWVPCGFCSAGWFIRCVSAKLTVCENWNYGVFVNFEYSFMRLTKGNKKIRENFKCWHNLKTVSPK